MVNKYYFRGFLLGFALAFLFNYSFWGCVRHGIGFLCFTNDSLLGASPFYELFGLPHLWIAQTFLFITYFFDAVFVIYFRIIVSAFISAIPFGALGFIIDWWLEKRSKIKEVRTH